ncbi:SMP-30/gluconolactonase/LRE family protein [Cellulomonas sp. KRMCY2]|uniref:SMP-30/gluconolactonase/LRE family protein n=1 Tax=Cellulomonas sp. KRMCY2 TaxID=1304865 RepID=UPI00045EAABE|nr:SMP-30/gluconolactonase/LRE family protein [Cellulomonas sp. KRMCY2]
MTLLEAHPATPTIHRLAEGPVWDAARGRVLWVDIDAGTVVEGLLHGNEIETVRAMTVDTTVGAVVPSPDGRLLVAGRDRLLVVEVDGHLTPGPAVLPSGSAGRLNDGACDPAGRFVVGSVTVGGATGHEVLTRLEDDGSLTVLDDDLWLSNGLAWSADPVVMYSVDTLPAIVWRRDYDVASRTAGTRREHLRITGGGLPDGLCLDTDGNLWVALWGAGQVRCYSPGGEVLHVVEVAAPHTSSVAFVGPELDRLLITTASAELDPAGLSEHPGSGRLYTAPVGALLGVHGQPTTPWNGRGIPPSPARPASPAATSEPRES